MNIIISLYGTETFLRRMLQDATYNPLRRVEKVLHHSLHQKNLLQFSMVMSPQEISELEQRWPDVWAHQRPLVLLVPSAKVCPFCQVKQRSGYMRKSLNKLSVKIGETQEALDLTFILRSGPICYTSYLDRIHFSLIMRNNKCQIFNKYLLKFTLFWTEIQLIFLKMLYDNLRDPPMFFQSMCKNQVVI